MNTPIEEERKHHPSELFLRKDRAQTAQAWMTIRPGVRMLVAAIVNKEYQAAQEKLKADDPEIDRKSAELIARHILLDWEGLEWEPTLENRTNLITDYTEVAARVLGFSSTLRNFVDCNGLEKELGN